MARKRILKKSIVSGLVPSSTSDMLKDLVFKGKTISKVMKKEGTDTRTIYYTDGTNEKLTKDDIKALARIKGGMEGEARSKALTPWERRERMARGMKVKESWLTRDKKDFIAMRNKVDAIAQQVEGAPKVKYVRRKGVNVPVIAHYFSTRQPDTKTLIDRVKQDMGRIWVWKLKMKLRKMTPSKAMEELLKEYKEK